MVLSIRIGGEEDMEHETTNYQVLGIKVNDTTPEGKTELKVDKSFNLSCNKLTDEQLRNIFCNNQYDLIVATKIEPEISIENVTIEYLGQKEIAH